MIKPKKIRVGSTAAIISPSWGGPSLFPHIFNNGLQKLKELGIEIKEYPTARMSVEVLERNIELRAKDINDAFTDPEVDLIIASIGGEDSIGVLPFLDIKNILKNPKIIVGYSDTSTILTYLNSQGLVTFNGPSVMAGFSQIDSLETGFKSNLKDFFFSEYEEFSYSPFNYYSNGYPDWSNVSNTGKINTQIKNDGWHFLQSKNTVTGLLFGGCIETLEQVKNSIFWPDDSFWEDRIIFFETSEDKPSLNKVRKMLLGYKNILSRVRGVLFGRARDYTQKEKIELDRILVDVISKKFANTNIPIISNMDFGHTDPQFIMPLGIKTKIDQNDRTVKLIENPFSN